MKILAGRFFSSLSGVFDELESKYPDLTFAHGVADGELTSAIKDTTVYLGWMTRELFLAAEKLEWIQSPSSGVDNILAIPEIMQSDVLVTSAVGTHAHVLADHAMAMILSFTRGLRELAFKQREKVWYSPVRARCIELRGLTMGIVGFGASGQQVARRASAFGMRVLAVDVAVKQKPDYVEQLGDAGDIDETIAQSDVVVIACPYTAGNRDLIGEKQLSLMKSNALLIGISRGGIINQPALVEALQARRIAGAALDIFDREPLPADSPLWDLENLLITPHSAGGTQYEIENICSIFVENLAKFIAGDFPLRNQVDKSRGW